MHGVLTITTIYMHFVMMFSVSAHLLVAFFVTYSSYMYPHTVTILHENMTDYFQEAFNLVLDASVA